MAPPEICSLCEVMFYLPGLWGILLFLVDEWEVLGILNKMRWFPFFPCTWPWPMAESLQTTKAMQCDLGVSHRQIGLTNEGIGDGFQSETGRSRAPVKHSVRSGTSQCCSPGLVLSQLSSGPPWKFSGCFYSPLWGLLPSFLGPNPPSLLLIFLALCLEMSILVPSCAITASCSDGPCFAVEIPASQMNSSILSREQQCLDLSFIFWNLSKLLWWEDAQNNWHQ